MPAVCFYFQVHQPRRLKRYRLFDIGKERKYFDDQSETNLNNKRVLEKVSQKCYLPANALFLRLLQRYPEFKISFSFSGVFLDQLEEYAPETLLSFQRLAETGQVELLAETYYHSLSFLYSRDEFRNQVNMHAQKIKTLFNQVPKIFRNTELIYQNELAKEVEKMGYQGVLSEGADHLLGWRSPNFLYSAPGGAPKILLKNYRLSDDIAFRFSSRDWSEWPLTAPKFADWISAINGNGEVVNLFMDYETFGEHQWAETGIFDFLEALPAEILKNKDNGFVTPREALKRFEARGVYDAPHYISWADIERDLSAWRSNKMQEEALAKVYALEKTMEAKGDPELLETWRRLQTSDHFYYMCTKWWSDGDVHKYFNPYESPYDAFISFMNVLNDLKLRL